MALDSSHTPVAYPSTSPNNVTSATWTFEIGTYTIPSGGSLREIVLLDLFAYFRPRSLALTTDS